MKKLLKILIGVVIIVSGFVIFTFGFRYGYNQIPEPPKGLPSDADISILWDVWQKIEDKYSGEIDYQKMIYGAARGMVAGLGDPYTAFFPPEESKIFQDDISGSFEGVGMEIGIRKGELTVIAPLEGTPAQRAGLLPGDKIIKVGDIYTQDITVEEAVRLIRGERGTTVVLTIYRKDWDNSKDFEVARDVIKIPTVKLEIIENNIAKINIYQFSSNLDLEFPQIVDKIINDGSVGKIILDLRNNPGGLLHEAQTMAGWFLEKGDVITTESFGNDKEPREYLATGRELLLRYPLVILINQGTASAAEILAAALRDNRDDVKLVGEKSFGKGSVQEPIDLRGGSMLKVTIAYWLTPKGELINDVGLTPDFEIEMTEEDYNEDRDPQLDKAIELLKEM